MTTHTTAAAPADGSPDDSLPGPDSAALLKGLKPVLKALEADLGRRAKDPGVAAALRVAWEREKKAGRTGASLAQWTKRRVTQVAIAWVLSVIFVRTLEDRNLLRRRRIAGSGAADSERLFTELAPFLTPRDYLLTVFRELSLLPGLADVFDPRHNPVWVLAPSADGASKLLEFFRTDSKAGPAPNFGGSDTRFLGDLYQHLSEDVRKRYALLQTPEFVEAFILEQTLDPAIATFGLDEVKLIDPTCGSGHFLLGAFRRLYEAWLEQAPGEDRQVLAQRAVGQVYGVDLNPYAVAVARFRLTLAFLQTVGIEDVARAPRLKLNLCVADSLLHGVVGEQFDLAAGETDEDVRRVWGERLFALEDEQEARRILGLRFEAVVGNPPYITEKDAKKRDQYRRLYAAAAGKFALAAPFTERFFGLGSAGGYIGLINANSFTKRDFGKTLIQEVLPKLDLRKVIDTSGAYIPGHGTPTLLLFGRNQEPESAGVVTVLGKRGEAEEPADPAKAPVWSEIVGHHDDDGFDGRHVSTQVLLRDELASHPWVLAGGGARELKAAIEHGCAPLNQHAASVGIAAVTGEDDLYLMPEGNARRVQCGETRPMILGEFIRDWRFSSALECVWPHDDDYGVVAPDRAPDTLRFLSTCRAIISRRKRFGTPMLQKGLTWYELQELYSKKLRTPLSIAFAFVATHNHFVLDRGGKVFNRSAPIIKLKDTHDEDDHLALLGYLNSSTACFWMKMVFYPKATISGDVSTVKGKPENNRYEFAGNGMKNLPIPSFAKLSELLPLAKRLDNAARRMAEVAPKSLLESWSPSAVDLDALFRAGEAETSSLKGQMVLLQEELDWRVYSCFDLCPSTAMEVPQGIGIEPSQRPYAWSDDALPRDLPPAVASVFARRRELQRDVRLLRLLEDPVYKRPWLGQRGVFGHKKATYWESALDACRDWLLDRLERLLEDQPSPAPMSARALAAELHRDAAAVAVASVLTDEPSPDLEALVKDLVTGDGVPYLAAWRYSDSGLDKHAEWRKTWDLQRREDAGEAVGTIPVPRKYAKKDFKPDRYWRHRGKLDVPKERFVLYPACTPEHDETPLAGWAGWDHLQKAQALAAIYQDRKTNEGWPSERLVSLLAGLHELVPWLRQWHNDPDPAFGGQRLGDFFQTFVQGELHEHQLSTLDLEAWRPA